MDYLRPPLSTAESWASTSMAQHPTITISCLFFFLEKKVVVSKVGVSGGFVLKHIDPPRIPTRTLLFLATAEILVCEQPGVEDRKETTPRLLRVVGPGSCQDRDLAGLRKRDCVVAFSIQAVDIGRFGGKGQAFEDFKLSSRIPLQILRKRLLKKKAFLSEDSRFRSEDKNVFSLTKA